MTATRVAPPATPFATPEILVLADGVELLGEYEDSGFREPPLLARRGDGQMVKLTPLLHAEQPGVEHQQHREQDELHGPRVEPGEGGGDPVDRGRVEDRAPVAQGEQRPALGQLG